MDSYKFILHEIIDVCNPPKIVKHKFYSIKEAFYFAFYNKHEKIKYKLFDNFGIEVNINFDAINYNNC